MKNKRLRYFLWICVIIILGLGSRELSMIPLFVGDALWGIMIFFVLQFVFIDIHIKALFFASLIVCYLVEFSQLYQVDWLNNLRNTMPGRLILGQGFLWSDIIAYTVGIAMVTLLKGLKLNRVKGRDQ